jgi:CheY-like chemotaxis protein
VIMNLCVNARDAMPDGGKLVLAVRNVDLSAAEVEAHPSVKAGPFVVISVADSGHGIPAAIVDRIFDPFFTTKPPTKGTGLGLSTVLGIVRSHGGFIAVTTMPGQGTTFAVHLPAAVDAAGVACSPPVEALPSGNGELILVVDDEEPIRRTMRLVLEQHGYRVLTAGEGAEAVSMFLQNRDSVRLVLTDVMMPVMNGVNLTRALRAVDAHVKVVASSGLTDKESHDELCAAGVNDIIAKPCNAREVLEAVRKQLAPVGEV